MDLCAALEHDATDIGHRRPRLEEHADARISLDVRNLPRPISHAHHDVLAVPEVAERYGMWESIEIDRAKDCPARAAVEESVHLFASEFARHGRNASGRAQSDTIHGARWRMRESAEARHKGRERDERCPFVCTREGALVLALHSNAGLPPENAEESTELEVQFQIVRRAADDPSRFSHQDWACIVGQVA